MGVTPVRLVVGLFKIPKNCGRWSFNLTCIQSFCGSTAKVIHHSHANTSSYTGYSFPEAGICVLALAKSRPQGMEGGTS